MCVSSSQDFRFFLLFLKREEGEERRECYTMRQARQLLNRSIASAIAGASFSTSPAAQSYHPSPPSAVLVGFCTDIEGDYQFWRKHVELSSVLVAPTANKGYPRLRDGCHFVYGGDATDRGGCDLRVLHELNMLKALWPDRVHLVLGNRDINKMRFLHELSTGRVALGVDAHPGAYWLNNKTDNALRPKDIADPSPQSDRATIAKCKKTKKGSGRTKKDEEESIMEGFSFCCIPEFILCLNILTY